MQIESVLRKDPIAGFNQIAANMGLNPVAVAQAIIHRAGPGAAQHAPVLAPDQRQQRQPAPQTQIDEKTLTNRILHQIQAQTAQSQITSEIQAFSSDPANRFFENVKGTMAALMQSGQAKTLKDAYDQACYSHPEIRPHMLQSQPGSVQKRAAAAVQAKSAAKAVTGASGPGTKSGSVPPANESTHDTVRRAVEEARGAV